MKLGSTALHTVSLLPCFEHQDTFHSPWVGFNTQDLIPNRRAHLRPKKNKLQATLASSPRTRLAFFFETCMTQNEVEMTNHLLGPRVKLDHTCPDFKSLVSVLPEAKLNSSVRFRIFAAASQ